MPAWIVNLLMPFVTALVSMWESELLAWFKKKIADYKQKKVDAKNIEALKNAQATGDQNAIAAAGESTLNGTDKP